MNAKKCIYILWREKFFSEGRTLRQASDQINEKWGHNFSSVEVSNALSSVSFLRRTGKRGKYKYIQKISPVGIKIADAEQSLFSDDFVKKIEKDFKTELSDLHLNFGSSGTCTAFMLRKILEKMIYLVFSRHSLVSKIEDTGSPNRLVGLEKMLNTATQEKINGIPVLTSKTSQNIRGIKFLGDSSAHNPLASIDMETIIPQMPFIITAYKELSARL
jgi:hypothetical protein